MEPLEKISTTYSHDPKWAIGVSRLIKSQMAATGITYSDLSNKLKTLGTTQTPENLRVKINRGNFGAQLFVQLLIVMGRKEVNLNELESIVSSLDM